MRIVHGYNAVPPETKGASLALGNFDGVHRGHQVLIGKAVEAARSLSRPAGVLLFEPHPRQFFKPHAPHFELTPLATQYRITLFDPTGRPSPSVDVSTS